MKKQDAEYIQELIAQVVATNPAGRKLALIGGFRYRLLDQSVRTSVDIDYHWAENLDEKQAELIGLFRRVLLSDVKRRWGYEGRADAQTGPDAESPMVRTIELAFWKPDGPRIEIPVGITRIACLDGPTIRTLNATIYSTPTDADMIESKVIALLNRTFLRHRDLADCFLFKSSLREDSRQRLAEKMELLAITHAAVQKRMGDLQKNRDYHIKALQEVIDSQFDLPAADQINDAGGAEIVFDAVMQLLDEFLPAEEECQ